MVPVVHHTSCSCIDIPRIAFATYCVDEMAAGHYEGVTMDHLADEACKRMRSFSPQNLSNLVVHFASQPALSLRMSRKRHVQEGDE